MPTAAGNGNITAAFTNESIVKIKSVPSHQKALWSCLRYQTLPFQAKKMTPTNRTPSGCSAAGLRHQSQFQPIKCLVQTIRNPLEKNPYQLRGQHSRSKCRQRQYHQNKFLLDVELKSKSRWSFRLGRIEWAKYTFERSADDPLELLGSARRGMQSGALARLGSVFVLVVGDHVTALSHADNKAIASLTTHAKPSERPFVFQPVNVTATSPVVVVIKRRRIPAPH